MPEAYFFVAEDPPFVVNDKGGRWLYMQFVVPISQLQKQFPFVYQHLLDESAVTARVMITHANEEGIIEQKNLEVVKKYDPDLLFTCYPGESRRMNRTLPIQGDWQSSTWVWDVHIDKQATRVIRIEKN